jgi:diaminopropionate ammonia-lyase
MISPKGYVNVNYTSSIKYIENPLARNCVNPKARVDFLDNSTTTTVRKFHESFPQYKKTPLVSLDKLAEHLGVSKIWVKDESQRFDLNAFKVLGGCYAVGKYLSQRLCMDLSGLSYKQLRSEELKAEESPGQQNNWDTGQSYSCQRALLKSGWTT